MAETASPWPPKSCEIRDDMMDSTRWNDLAWRADDIVIASWGKAGTTWVQQIVAQLVFDGEDAAVGEISPWLEFVMFPKDAVLGTLASQTHRRFI
jgi:aryl sulfotransferase